MGLNISLVAPVPILYDKNPVSWLHVYFPHDWGLSSRPLRAIFVSMLEVHGLPRIIPGILAFAFLPAASKAANTEIEKLNGHRSRHSTYLSAIAVAETVGHHIRCRIALPRHSPLHMTTLGMGQSPFRTSSAIDSWATF